jgi:hypothetical protein
VTAATRKPKVVVPVAVVEAPVWRETTVHLVDLLDALEEINATLVAIRQLLEERT